MPHRPTQKIRLPQRKSCQYLNDLHNLLLIKNNPKGFLQNRLQKRMKIGNLLLSSTSVDKILHHAAAQRAGAVKRYRGNKILEAFGMNIFNQRRHPCRFHLKDSSCFSFAQHLRCLFVTQGNFPQIKLNSPARFDVFDGISQNG